MHPCTRKTQFLVAVYVVAVGIILVAIEIHGEGLRAELESE
jgi:hypothetical protein